MNELIEANIEADFSIDTILTFRKSLSCVQQVILDHVWENHLFTDKNYPVRSLPKIIGKVKIAEALNGVNGLYINEANDIGYRALKLNVLGALLSAKGSNLVELLLSLLDFVRDQYLEDSQLSSLTSQFLQDHLKLTDTEVIALFKLMSLYGLYNLPFGLGGWRSPQDWAINISDEIIEFNTFDDSKTYLSIRLNEFYIHQVEQMKNPKSISVMDYFINTNNKVSELKVDLTKPSFISLNRINAFQSLKNSPYDCTRLICLCNELNDCATRENTHAVAMLTRAILDHIPPIFGYKSFSEVASNYNEGGRSFKLSSELLNKQMRYVADRFLHMRIRDKEVIPDMHEVNFSRELESVLSEVCRVLK